MLLGETSKSARREARRPSPHGRPTARLAVGRAIGPRPALALSIALAMLAPSCAPGGGQQDPAAATPAAVTPADEASLAHQAPPPRNAFLTSELSVPHIKDAVAARTACRAAAEASQARWTGLWWTPDRHGPSVCLVEPAQAGLAEPVLEAISCGDDDLNACQQLPLEMQTNATSAVDVHERPDTASRVIGALAAGATATVYDRMIIQHFSHRGVVRTASPVLAAGQVVFPWREDDPLPWRTTPRRPDETAYSVMTPPMMELYLVPLEGPPVIDWEALPRPAGPAQWILLKAANGAKGWADGDALAIDFSDPDGDE